MGTNLYERVVTGLHCGINMRMMRYSDVRMRAAECENEVRGRTQQAIDWINQVRNRAQLPGLKLADFSSKDKLFEQIANVEGGKERGCEFGGGADRSCWGFFYTDDGLQQRKAHGAVILSNDARVVKNPVDYATLPKNDDKKLAKPYKTSYDTFVGGDELIPIYQGLLNANPNLRGNSANNNTNNAVFFTEQGWSVHPVVTIDH